MGTNFADMQSSHISLDASDFTEISRGAGWSNPGKPVTLIETVHSYGTHLSVENPTDAPEALRRWKAKVRQGWRPGLGSRCPRPPCSSHFGLHA